MSDHGILFSAPMVRALWAGRKTQTRRIAKAKRGMTIADYAVDGGKVGLANVRELPVDKLKVPYLVGDRLWVREAWRVAVTHDARKPTALPVRRCTVLFEAGGSISNTDCNRWEPDEWPKLGEQCSIKRGRLRASMFLPRWASRMTLIVTDVRVQRLLEISEEDAVAEGIRFTDHGMYQPPGEMSIDGGRRFHKFLPRQHDGWHWQEVAKPGECLGSPVSAYANLWNHINGDGAATANPWVIAYTFDVHKANIDDLAS